MSIENGFRKEWGLQTITIISIERELNNKNVDRKSVEEKMMNAKSNKYVNRKRVNE